MLKPVIAVVGAAALVVGLWAFQPWRVFTSSEVDEAAPISDVVASDPAVGDGPSPTDEASTPTARPDRILARGDLEDAEHGTNGTAVVIELGDGRRFLRFEDLATSDGPDLHVWLTDQPSGGEWGSYDDGRYLRLGELKATHGNQNYEIPADADLSGLTSVVIWCDRFNVAFGTAPVELA